jgi:hypothetical protein
MSSPNEQLQKELFLDVVWRQVCVKRMPPHCACLTGGRGYLSRLWSTESKKKLAAPRLRVADRLSGGLLGGSVHGN